jgi:DNA-binding transcriptional LysR family regulator
MDLRQLAYFEAVAEQGTYTAAAERMHVAQPALWKLVHELERELGVALFERVGRRVRITAAGLALLERVRPVVAGAERIRELAGDLRAGHAGRIRIGCFAPHIAAFLAPVMARFRDAHPDIAMELHDYATVTVTPRRSTNAVIESLRAGETDIIISAPFDDDTCSGFPVYDVRVVVAAPPRHSLHGRQRIDVGTLRDEALVVSPPGYFSRTQLEGACRRAGFEPHIEAESSSPAALLARTAHGIGTAVLASDAVSTDRRTATLTIARKPLHDEVWLYHRSPNADPAVNQFVAVARSYASR